MLELSDNGHVSGYNSLEDCRRLGGCRCSAPGVQAAWLGAASMATRGALGEAREISCADGTHGFKCLVRWPGAHAPLSGVVCTRQPWTVG